MWTHCHVPKMGTGDNREKVAVIGLIDVLHMGTPKSHGLCFHTYLSQVWQPRAGT